MAATEAGPMIAGAMTSAGEAPGVAAPAEGRPSSNKPRVLIVDDSSTIRKSVMLFLGPLPIEMVFAEDGYAALKEFQNEPLPSLVLADVLMPRLSGIHLCSLIKGQPRTSAIPFFVLSSKDGDVDKAYAELCGVNGYLIKPFKKAELQGVVRAALNLPSD